MLIYLERRYAGDGSGRLFIVLQAGSIVIFDGKQVLPTPFLNVSSLLLSGGERGLLGLAFHPDYVNNGYFYVYYTRRPDGALVIARYSVSADDPNVADPASALILFTTDHPQFSNHNGGQLKFGPDGYLYAGPGDGGSGGDPFNRAQNLGEFLGKLLRFDVDSAEPYAIPPDNPFIGVEGARPEIWAYGLRNPWRFSFDRLTNDLYIADVGQNLWEEIDFQPASSTGGENYGWRRMEGFHCFNPSTNCDDGTLTLPVWEYGHGLGCSVTGGYVYRGEQYPALYGTYLYGDYCSGRIWGLTQDKAGNWSNEELARPAFPISTFGEDEAGEVYVARYASNGAIYHIVSN
jgi:glucose/arabinose dehydrogenase